MNLIQEMKNTLSEIERKYPVATWKIGKVDVWPFIRQDIGMKTLANEIESGAEKVVQSEECRNDSSLKIKDLDEEIDAIFFYDSISKVRLGEKWFSRLTDPIFLNLSAKNYKVANLEFSGHGVLRKDSVSKYYDIQKELEGANSPCFVENIYLPCFKEVEQIINGILVLKNRSMLNEVQVYERALKIEQKANYLYEIFKRVKPKVVFIINYYSTEGAACILAANMANCISVDIEHGNQSYFYYHGWGSIKGTGYNILPNIFWNWTAESSEKVNIWAKETTMHKSIIGGNNWIDFWRDKENKLILNEIDKVVKYTEKGNKNFLVTLQPKYGLSGWKKNIPDELLEVINNSPENWKFFFRYHPGMLGYYRKEMQECEKVLETFKVLGKVETDIATSAPLPALLNIMDVHITGYSTCVKEAKEFGVPSITLHPNDVEYYKEYLEKGHIIQARSANDISNAISAFLNDDIEILNRGKVDVEEKYLSIIDIFPNKVNPVIKEFESDSSDVNFDNFNNKSVLEKNRIKINISEIFKKSELLKKAVIIRLYNQNNKDALKFLATFVEPFIDLDYILGRIYHSEKEYLLAIEYLSKFIVNYKNENQSYFNQKSHIMSAYLYLGESYYFSNEKDAAKKCFEKCVELSGYRHYKAESYLEIL